MTGQQWGDLVRSYFPGYSGHRPRLQHWHGTADTTLNYKNLAEDIKEWTNLLGLGESPTATDTPKSGTTHQLWKSACGYTVYETFSLAGVGHAVPFDGNGVAAYFGLDRAGGQDPETAACPGAVPGAAGAGGAGGSGGATGNGGAGGAADGSGGGRDGAAADGRAGQGGGGAGSGGAAGTIGGGGGGGAGGSAAGGGSAQPTGSSSGCACALTDPAAGSGAIGTAALLAALASLLGRAWRRARVPARRDGARSHRHCVGRARARRPVRRKKSIRVMRLAR
jgi:hypothetical protein